MHPVLMAAAVVMAVFAVGVTVYVYGAAILAVGAASLDVLGRAWARLFGGGGGVEADDEAAVVDMNEHYDPLKDESLLRMADEYLAGAGDGYGHDDGYDDDVYDDGEYDEFGDFHYFDDETDPYWDEVYGPADELYDDFVEGAPDDDDGELPDNVIRFPKKR